MWCTEIKVGDTLVIHECRLSILTPCSFPTDGVTTGGVWFEITGPADIALNWEKGYPIFLEDSPTFMMRWKNILTIGEEVDGKGDIATVKLMAWCKSLVKVGIELGPNGPKNVEILSAEELLIA